MLPASAAEGGRISLRKSEAGRSAGKRRGPVALARLSGGKTGASNGWTATRLAMTHPESVNRMLSTSRSCENLAKACESSESPYQIA